jgi:hypothetical protein
MAQHYNRILGLSKDLAERLPASVKKSESQLGIIVLFEKAVSLVQSRRYEDLSSVLKQIQRKAYMELLTRNDDKFLPKLLRIYATKIQLVLYAGHSKKTERVWKLTDSITTNINEKSSFVWIGKDGRYIDVASTYHSLYSVADGQGWLEFRITVILKHLREEHKNETIVFEFKKDPNDDSYHHTIEDCIFDHDKEENYFRSDDVKKIVQWLQLDLTTQISPRTFVLEMLLGLAFITERRTHKYLSTRVFNHKKYNEQIKDFDGDMAKEISKLMQCYLNGEADWASTKFVIKRLLLKVAFLQCIDNRTQFSSDDAKKELTHLFERAEINEYKGLKSALFFIPMTKCNEATTVVNRSQKFELLLPTAGRGTKLIVNVECDGDLIGDLIPVYEFEMFVVKKEPTPAVQFRKVGDRTTLKFASNIAVNDMDLNSVTSDDIFALMSAYFDYPRSLDSIREEVEQTKEDCKE